MKGRRHPQMKGRKHTEEQKRKLSEALMGHSVSEETKRKQSEAKLGGTLTAEHKQKISEALRGENGPRWKGGITFKSGYAYLCRPWHPYAGAQGYISEARLIVEEVLGRYLKRKEVVHHIDGDVLNNTKNNLLICTSSYHMWLHNKQRRIKHESITIK